MRLPRKVTISGRDYEVIIDKSISGGEWSSSGTIRLNPRAHTPLATLFIHEALEALLAMRGHRYEKNELCNCEDIFLFTHPQFCLIVEELANILKPLFKDGKP